MSNNDAQQRLAVFDFDGTCIDGQSGALFYRYLSGKGLVSARGSAHLLWWATRYLLHLPYRQGEAREAIFDRLQELPCEQVDELMLDFHNTVLRPRYRPQALQEIARRKHEGMTTVLTSATFEGIAQPALNELGVDVMLATRMERDGRGHYTGLVDGPVIAGEEKPRAVKAWADSHIGPGKWHIACAYGDHHSDEFILTKADQAFAVCPDRTLKVLAKKRNWPILTWDV